MCLADVNFRIAIQNHMFFVGAPRKYCTNWWMLHVCTDFLKGAATQNDHTRIVKDQNQSSLSTTPPILSRTMNQLWFISSKPIYHLSPSWRSIQGKVQIIFNNYLPVLRSCFIIIHEPFSLGWFAYLLTSSPINMQCDALSHFWRFIAPIN